MKKIIYILTCVVLVGCHRNTVTVSGTTDRDSVRLEEMTLPHPTVLKCQKGGEYTFHIPRTNTPQLYRINGTYLVIDSTIESVLLVNDSLVSGNPGGDSIRLLRQSLQTRSLVDHKTYAQGVILRHPESLWAYYALFQYTQGQYVFDLTDAGDRRFFQAVATALFMHYPDDPRARILRDQVLAVLRAERQAQTDQLMQRFIEESSNTLLNIELPDADGVRRSLASCKGSKYTLLDFSAVSMENSSAYYLQLREIYNKYSSQGLTIFSVSADRSQLVWDEGVRALPWTCVRGINGPDEECFRTYNVRQLPTVYLLDKDGFVERRVTDLGQLTINN